MRRNICYHTRSYSGDVKTSGGTFGGQIDRETVDRLTGLFSVTVKPSGQPVFVDRDGREVRLYLYVDPADTVKGCNALAEYRKAKFDREAKEQQDRDKQEEAIQTLLDSMTPEEIIRRLS